MSNVSLIPVVQQLYATEVNNEYVIQGNSAVLKCSIPSFVADYVLVVSWQDDAGNTFTTHEDYGTYIQRHTAFLQFQL